MQFIHWQHSEIYFVSRQVSSSVALSDSMGEKTLHFARSRAQRPREHSHRHGPALNREAFTAGSRVLEDMAP